ncbi:MAG: ATP-binding cassette domain-containing protein [Lachnospiraceae bacterium]|nr:ATP-binding cassette domain-containing protein [Lachnospiraceae bacterium]
MENNEKNQIQAENSEVKHNWEKYIPKSLLKMLKSYELNTEDIVYVAESDIDEELRFVQNYIILSKDRLAVAFYPYKEAGKFSFGGYKRQGDFTDVESDKPVLKIYFNEDIEKLEIIRDISGGTLIGKISGDDIRICRFSNSKMGEMERLTRNINKVKKGEELNDKDIHGKQKMECCPKCGTLYPDQERKICPKCMDKKSLFMRVMKYFLKYKWRLCIMMVCYLGVGILNLAWPYLSGTFLYDKVLSQDPKLVQWVDSVGGKFTILLGFTVIAMIVTKILIQLLGMIHGAMTARIVPDVVAELKQEIFNSMGKLSISFFNSRQTGGLMTRVLDDASIVTGFFIDGLPYIFVNAFTIISTCVIMFRINPLLAVAALVLLPFLTIQSYRMLPRLWTFYGKRHRASRRLSGQLNDNITGARVIKAFGQQEQELKRLGKGNAGVREAELDVMRFDNKYYALYASVENIISFVVWGLGSAIVLSTSSMEFGMLVTFAGYVTQLNGPLDFMSHVFRWMTDCLNASQRMFEIIDAVPDVREAENPVRPEYIEGNIEISNMTFGYEPYKPVLKNITFEVKAGEMLGIVGRSGAGKSTLVNLISRLYDPSEGYIKIDGIDVKEMGFAELRKSISMVSQETYIFMGTVAENIAYAKPEASRKEIIEAAMQASAHDFICKMPQGYDTIIGSAGRTLSGGEKQRISIARAILANPRILILDEATSAVDTETEQAIQESLDKLVKGRTTLSIAHRLSTLKNADKLIVIDDGKITESGTHKELIEQKGTYYKLMQLQTKALAMRGI